MPSSTSPRNTSRGKDSLLRSPHVLRSMRKTSHSPPPPFIIAVSRMVGGSDSRAREEVICSQVLYWLD